MKKVNGPMFCLIHQTNYLLDQQRRQLEQTFLEEGGFTERLYQARQQARRSNPPAAPSHSSYRSYSRFPKPGAPPKNPPAKL